MIFAHETLITGGTGSFGNAVLAGSSHRIAEIRIFAATRRSRTTCGTCTAATS